MPNKLRRQRLIDVDSRNQVSLLATVTNGDATFQGDRGFERATGASGAESTNQRDLSFFVGSIPIAGQKQPREGLSFDSN